MTMTAFLVSYTALMFSLCMLAWLCIVGLRCMLR